MYGAVRKSCQKIPRHSKSNPIELNPWIEFDLVRQSNEIELTHKKIVQSNSIEHSIFKRFFDVENQ